MPGSQTTRGGTDARRYRIRPCCLLLPRRHRHPGLHCFRRSQPGLHTPLSTLRVTPRGATCMTRGRCGSLPLHRSGLSPPTSCRSPGAPRLNGWPHWVQCGGTGRPALEFHAGDARAQHPSTPEPPAAPSFFTLSKRKGLPHVSGSRSRDRRIHVERKPRNGSIGKFWTCARRDTARIRRTMETRSRPGRRGQGRCACVFRSRHRSRQQASCAFRKHLVILRA